MFSQIAIMVTQIITSMQVHLLVRVQQELQVDQVVILVLVNLYYHQLALDIEILLLDVI